MKLFILSLFAYLLTSVAAQASVRSDVAVLEASEGIQSLSQQMAKDYLLYCIYPAKQTSVAKINDDLKELNEHIKKISLNSSDPKTKMILSYFTTQNEVIRELLDKGSSTESILDMVEISDVLSEGAQSIASRHQYPFNDEERMLMLTKKLATLFGSLVKYYMVSCINPSDKIALDAIKKTETEIDAKIDILNAYEYVGDAIADKTSINKSWNVLRNYARRVNQVNVPALLSILGDHIQSSLYDLGIYHSRNQQ